LKRRFLLCACFQEIRTIKGNQHKLQFASVPKLREEVEKRNKYIEEEKYHMGKVGELDKRKEEVKIFLNNP